MMGRRYRTVRWARSSCQAPHHHLHLSDDGSLGSVFVITDRTAIPVASAPSTRSVATAAARPGARRAAPGARALRQRPVHLISTVVGVVGAIVVTSLVWLTGVVNSHTQARLLHIQTDAAGVVIGELVPTILTPLTTATAIADTSHGDVADVERYVASQVGSPSKHLFVSLSLWRLSPSGPVRMLMLGRHSTFDADAGALESVFRAIPAPGTLTVVDLMGKSPPRVGFAVEGVGATPRYVVLAELATPPRRRAVVPAASAFHDLEFALYVGRRPVASHLFEATTPPPVIAPAASVRVPFGTTVLDLVASAQRPLGGGVLPALPWIVGTLGAVLVVGAVVISEWLMRRRRTAEHLARENLRLYAEQRSISQTLQNALLPQRFPVVPGVEFAARYVPGDSSADVGGDWYDVIRCNDRSFIFAIGDVSGHDIQAANVMASLHYAIRAYAAQGDDAETILHKLRLLLDVGRDGHFATVLLGHVDVPDRRVTVVNAGHLPPLVVSGAGAHFVEAPPGTPIGVAQTVRYDPLTVELPRGASLLAYTDGLVERRGELIDTGMDRLRATAVAAHSTPGQLLDVVVASLADEIVTDDIALLAVHWTD
jgi:hypothetical protein